MKHTVDLSKWLAFWGVKGGQVPDLVPSVQPTISLGTTELVVPEFAPCQNFGGAVIAPTNSGTYCITAPAQGGALVDWLSLYDVSGNQVVMRWKILSSDFGGTTVDGDEVVPTPVSFMTQSDTAAVSVPYMFCTQTATAFRALYIPGGKVGCIQAQDAATTTLLGCRVRDVVVDRGDS